jgi:hypothetical protein
MSPLPLAPQSFQTVSRRSRKIAQIHRTIQLAKLSASDLFDRSKAPARMSEVEPLGFPATERPDHLPIV